MQDMNQKKGQKLALKEIKLKVKKQKQFVNAIVKEKRKQLNSQLKDINIERKRATRKINRKIKKLSKELMYRKMGASM